VWAVHGALIAADLGHPALLFVAMSVTGALV
jgi:hypothetical protein